MATLAGRTAVATTPRIKAGVEPLRAGEGRSFLLRRLHSLSGIVPVGAFLTEHFISNAFATNGPRAYIHEVEFLTGIPFLLVVESLFIYLPILFHGLFGFWIWYRGESNVGDYSFSGNWGYMVQRWTGGIAFFYMLWHTLTMRWMEPHIVGNAGIAFAKVQHELQNPYAVVFYIVGITCASLHFFYGLWLFSAKWGITTGQKGRRNLGFACAGGCLLFLVIGYAALYSFLTTPLQPLTAPTQATEQTNINH